MADSYEYDLDEESRRTIRRAILEKGLEASMNGGWWTRSKNNWNQVCNGGLTIGALAIMEHEPAVAARIINRAIDNIPRAMKAYQPDGAYPEGPLYWEYGTSYNVLLVAGLESVLGTDFGLLEKPGFLESATYFQQSTGPTGLIFNYSDCRVVRGHLSAAQFYLAAKQDDPCLLYLQKQFLLRPRHQAGDKRDMRFLPLVFVWARDLDRVAAPKDRHWKGDGRNPVAMLRSGWGKDEVYVGIKAGSPGQPHAHMDIGSFVLDADGVRWAEDLGKQGYHGLTSSKINLWNMAQQSSRWNVFRLNTFSHNTLVVDGRNQVVKARAEITAFSDDNTRPFVIVDLSEVYGNQLARARRGFALVGKTVVIQDELQAMDRQTAIRWAMATGAKVTIKGNTTAVLEKGGEQLTIRLQSPAGAGFEL